MKLIVAIIQDYDTDALLRSVTEAGFRVTRISSTGGFLRSGNTTVFLGVEDDEVQRCAELIRHTCRSRHEEVTGDIEGHLLEVSGADVTHVPVGGAVIFVMPIERYERMTT
jgi:uncharacterized protein YaaQ